MEIPIKYPLGTKVFVRKSRPSKTQLVSCDFCEGIGEVTAVGHGESNETRIIKCPVCEGRKLKEIKLDQSPVVVEGNVKEITIRFSANKNGFSFGENGDPLPDGSGFCMVKYSISGDASGWTIGEDRMSLSVDGAINLEPGCSERN